MRQKVTMYTENQRKSGMKCDIWEPKSHHWRNDCRSIGLATQPLNILPDEGRYQHVEKAGFHFVAEIDTKE